MLLVHGQPARETSTTVSARVVRTTESESRTCSRLLVGPFTGGRLSLRSTDEPR